MEYLNSTYIWSIYLPYDIPELARSTMISLIAADKQTMELHRICELYVCTFLR